MSRRAWSAASVLLFVSYLLLHLPASDVFDGFARRFGFVAYDRTTRFIFALAGAGVWLWLWSAHESVRARVRTSLVAITVLAGLAGALLAVNGIEAIHLPQYALLVCTLSASGLGLEAAWLVATALGGLDELWQWLLLRRAVPEYFDWNDVVLNGIGAAVGVLAIARARGLSQEQTLPRTWVSFAMSGSLIAAALSRPVVSQPFYRYTAAGRWFHLASAFEAALILAALWLTVRHAIGDPSTMPRSAPAPQMVRDAVADGPESPGQ